MLMIVHTMTTFSLWRAYVHSRRNSIMGVTAIKALVNNSSVAVNLQDFENPDKQGNSCTAQPGETAACDIWIPWCTSAEDFSAGKFIAMSIPADVEGATQWIWQEAVNGNDRVRFNVNPFYHPDATVVPGDSTVDGDRIITIGQDKSFTFHRIG